MKLEFISPVRTLQIEIANIINSRFEISLAPSEVLIDVCYPKYDAHYTSAIALAIANRLNKNPLNKNPLAIAEEICLPKISSQWQIAAFGKGWLNIFLSEQYLAESLSALNLFALNIWQPDISDMFINSVGESPEPTMQYAYARCCALIRLANRSINFLITDIVWDCIEPAEISLLIQQLAIADLLESNAHLDKAKLSRSLATIFLQFYDRCRIFGVMPEIACRRLLLIRVTQKLLLAIAPLGINYAIYL